MAVKSQPEGFHTVTPYLIVDDAAKSIEFLEQTFDAAVGTRHVLPDGKIMHAEVKLGDSVIMLSDARDDFGPMPAMLYVYVDDADVAYRRAIGAGATSLREPADELYGDRAGGVLDLWGNHWWMATHKEDVPPEKIAERASAMAAKQGAG